MEVGVLLSHKKNFFISKYCKTNHITRDISVGLIMVPLKIEAKKYSKIF